jgi:nitroreductase
MSTLLLNPWDVREADFPATGSPAEQLRFLLHYAVLAPSGHNTQPWLFKIDGGAVELYADRSRALPVVDPDDRELTSSCGAALLHLRVALRHFGYMGTINPFPDPEDPDLLARVRLGKSREASTEEHALFQAITMRRTNRQAFEQREVPAPVLVALQEMAHAEGTWFYVAQDEYDRSALVNLVALADRMQWADAHFRRELVARMRSKRSQRRDGIPGYALSLGDLASYVGPVLARTFDVDTAYDWFMAGQAVERILLYARSQGVWASFLNQPIEVPQIRLMLHNIIERVGFPQLLLRMGYGSEVPPTPRRSVNEVLLE